jgi:hypothetical protein
MSDIDNDNVHENRGCSSHLTFPFHVKDVKPKIRAASLVTIVAFAGRRCLVTVTYLAHGPWFVCIGLNIARLLPRT